jgi:hypothetical protein
MMLRLGPSPDYQGLRLQFFGKLMVFNHIG